VNDARKGSQHDDSDHDRTRCIHPTECQGHDRHHHVHRRRKTVHRLTVLFVDESFALTHASPSLPSLHREGRSTVGVLPSRGRILDPKRGTWHVHVRTWTSQRCQDLGERLPGELGSQILPDGCEVSESKFHQVSSHSGYSTYHADGHVSVGSFGPVHRLILTSIGGQHNPAPRQVSYCVTSRDASIVTGSFYLGSAVGVF
jgi:hypothetical protein